MSLFLKLVSRVPWTKTLILMSVNLNPAMTQTTIMINRSVAIVTSIVHAYSYLQPLPRKPQKIVSYCRSFTDFSRITTTILRCG